MREAFRRHWPEYLMEALGLGLFMVSAGLFGTLLEHPSSPLRAAIPGAFLRRALMGLAMGATAVALIHSPWGRRSGAHLNPAVTLTFLRLRKTTTPDAIGYAVFQALGGATGLLLVSLFLGEALGHPSVRHVATQPGRFGAGAAFVAEALISFGLMLMVLVTTNHARWARHTPVLAGCLVATYIALEAPVSGMSMNPARSFSSALHARLWEAYWIYLLAPPLGMLVAAELYVRRCGVARVLCAKLHHRNAARCIFQCNYPHG